MYDTVIEAVALVLSVTTTEYVLEASPLGHRYSDAVKLCVLDDVEPELAEVGDVLPEVLVHT